MTNVSSRTRMSVSLLALVSMLVHSGGETAILIGIAAGGALLMIGLWVMFRAAAVGGFLIAVGLTAHFTHLDTMTDAQDIVFVTVALLIPALAMGWAALTAEVEHSYRLELRSRQVLVAALFAVVCMASVPVVMVLARLVAPSVSSEPSTMLEVAIILTAASIPLMYFFTLEPGKAEPELETSEPE